MSIERRPGGALGLVLVLVLAVSGCTEGALPRVMVTIADAEVPWGGAAQFTIRNVGDGPAPAPIEVTIVSANGTPVRTYADVTGGRGIPAGGQISLSWSGLNADETPVLWGRYTLLVGGYGARASVELLRPPHYAITADAIPRVSRAGTPLEFRVNNTGTTWVNGTLTLAAGREELLLYSAEVRVEVWPGGAYSFFWNGRTPAGGVPEAQKYLVAARVEPDDGPRPFAQDVFTLT